MIKYQSKILINLIFASFLTSPRAESATQKPHGYFISIDGMRPDYLTTLVKEGKLNQPRGLGWLYRNGVFAKKAWPVGTTLTAPSHVSTITCSYPSDHGIVANNFLKNGALVSGFSEEIQSETLWQAARADGRKVQSFGYAGTDGNSPAREVDVGVAYPDAKNIAPSQAFTWKLADLQTAQGWTLAGDLLPRPSTTLSNLRETTVKFVLNPISKEERVIQVLVFSRKASDGTLTTEVVFSTSKNLANSEFVHISDTPENGQVGHLFFVEESAESPTKGYKRHIYLALQNRTADSISVFASRPTYNHAQPAAYRQALDAANLVWPDDGWRGDRTPTGPLRQVAMYNLHGKFLAEAAKVARDGKWPGKFDSDVTLFYQPVIDSIGHTYQALIPQPFSSINADPYSQAMVRAFQNVDANVSSMLEKATGLDVIALMGDHGMDPIKKVANLAALIPEHSGKIRVVTSGSLALLYRTPETSDAETDVIGALIQTKLLGLKFEGASAYGKSFRRSDSTPQVSNPNGKWQYGDAVWAFTSSSGFYFMYNATSSDTLVEPSALGMHGNDNIVETMATGFLFKAPGGDCCFVVGGWMCPY